MSVFREALIFFDQVGLYDVVLPFLLVFTLVFGVLEKSKILGTEKGGDGEMYTRKNLNAMVAFISGFFVVASAQLGASPVLAIVALSVSAIAIHAALPVFWTLPTSMLAGTAAAAGIALINSIGNVGGFVGPSSVGYAREMTDSYSTGLIVVAVSLAGAACAALAVPRNRALEAASAHQRL